MAVRKILKGTAPCVADAARHARATENAAKCEDER